MTRRCVRNRGRAAAIALLPGLALLACSGEPRQEGSAAAPRDNAGTAALPDPPFSPPSAPQPTPRPTQDQAVTPESVVGIDDAPPDGLTTNAALPAVAAATYRCDDGRRIDARFDNRANNVTLRVAGTPPIVLAGQRAASGIWYRGDGAELRGKGDAATVTLNGTAPVQCRAVN